jgi:2-dehydro-3-deoxyphosphogluconate aldolase/(4S)-4-hydroxy-2-oxoglutarate aldolase
MVFLIKEHIFSKKGVQYLSQVLSEIKKHKLVAIIRGDSIQSCEATVNSLYKGGIRIVEITMNTPGALRGIERIRETFPEMVVGAGTVLDAETARSAILAGASFLLAPTLKTSTIELGNRYNVPVVPGVFTPTEALNAYEAGARMVKVFPIRNLGPKYISDIHGPLPHLEIMSVGGISLANAESHLNAGSCALGIGSSLVDDTLVQNGDFQEIEKRARRFVDILDGVESSKRN